MNEECNGGHYTSGAALAAQDKARRGYLDGPLLLLRRWRSPEGKPRNSIDFIKGYPKIVFVEQGNGIDMLESEKGTQNEKIESLDTLLFSVDWGP